MFYTPKIISQTVAPNPLPVMSRGTAATNMDYFLEMIFLSLLQDSLCLFVIPFSFFYPP